jgi:sulfopropanediol 3-dehydrogenase
MSRVYLKKATLTSRSEEGETAKVVAKILADIEIGGETAALEYATKFDKYDGGVQLTLDDIESASALVPRKIKDDILFAHDNVRRFAEAQKATVADLEYEINPGLIAGQKAIPVTAAGCYVPAGRYRHIASAIMTVTTAKVAGCEHITVCSAPQPGVGLYPAIVYAAHVCGDSFDGFWFVWPTKSQHDCRPWKPVCGGGKTFTLRTCRNRHDCRTY